MVSVLGLSVSWLYGWPLVFRVSFSRVLLHDLSCLSRVAVVVRKCLLHLPMWHFRG